MIIKRPPNYKLNVCRTQLNQRDSTFLRLPAEIRNRIYESACCQSVVILYPGDRSRKRYPDDGRDEAPKGLMFACRQTYHEAYQYILDHCIFSFIGMQRKSKKYLKLQGLIRSVELNSYQYPIWEWGKMLVSHARRVEIPPKGGSRLSFDWTVKEPDFPGVHSLHVISGLSGSRRGNPKYGHAEWEEAGRVRFGNPYLEVHVRDL